MLGRGVLEELVDQAGPGITAAHSSRGYAFGDFDNDGDLDILVVNLNEPPSLLRNDLHGHSNWLKLKLAGTKSNRSAIGTRVVLPYGTRTQTQPVLSQSSYYSANDPRLHFGLGVEKTADVEIYWPSGLKQQLKSIAANQLVTVKVLELFRSWMAETLAFPAAAYFRTYCSWVSLLISATSSGLYAVPSLRKISWNHTAGSRSVYGCFHESQGRYVCVLPATRPQLMAAT
jgi:ASPIC and UnbV